MSQASTPPPMHGRRALGSSSGFSALASKPNHRAPQRTAPATRDRGRQSPVFPRSFEQLTSSSSRGRRSLDLAETAFDCCPRRASERVQSALVIVLKTSSRLTFCRWRPLSMWTAGEGSCHASDRANRQRGRVLAKGFYRHFIPSDTGKNLVNSEPGNQEKLAIVCFMVAWRAEFKPPSAPVPPARVYQHLVGRRRRAMSTTSHASRSIRKIPAAGDAPELRRDIRRASKLASLRADTSGVEAAAAFSNHARRQRRVTSQLAVPRVVSPPAARGCRSPVIAPTIAARHSINASRGRCTSPNSSVMIAMCLAVS